MVSMDYNGTSWAAIGRGSLKDIVRAEGSKLKERLNNFLWWEENVGKFEFLVTVRTALEPPLHALHCGHTKMISYREEPMESHGSL